MFCEKNKKIMMMTASLQEGPRFDSWLGQGLSMCSLHVLPVFAWVSSGRSGFFHHQNIYICLSPVSTDRGTGLESGVCFLRSRLNVETKFHCKLLYM